MQWSREKLRCPCNDVTEWEMHCNVISKEERENAMNLKSEDVYTNRLNHNCEHTKV